MLNLMFEKNRPLFCRMVYIRHWTQGLIAHGRSGGQFECVNFTNNPGIDILSNPLNIAFLWMKLMFLKVMVWCHQAINNHLSQCWPRYGSIWRNWATLCSWWRHQMETFSALLAICAGNSPVPGEFPAQRPATRSFDLRLNKRLRKQSWGWWFEILSHPLWRHFDVLIYVSLLEDWLLCDYCEKHWGPFY